MTQLSETGHTLHTADGIDIYYRRHAPPAPRGTLVFLHGAASNHTRWSEFLETTSLTRDWSTLRLDLRGHGRSHGAGAISTARWCDDLAQLLDAERCPRAIVVGHSLGANVALHFACAYPQRTEALILIDPAHPQTLRLPLPAALARVLLYAAARGVHALNACGVRRRKVSDLDLRQLDRHARELLAQQRDAEMEALYSSVREDLRHTRTATYLSDIAAVLDALPTPPETPMLLLLSAGRDATVLNISRNYAGQLPNVRIVEIPTNHWILTAAPEAARLAIESWNYFEFPRRAYSAYSFSSS